jgi:hypothetical protein
MKTQRIGAIYGAGFRVRLDEENVICKLAVKYFATAMTMHSCINVKH